MVLQCASHQAVAQAKTFLAFSARRAAQSAPASPEVFEASRPFLRREMGQFGCHVFDLRDALYSSSHKGVLNGG